MAQTPAVEKHDIELESTEPVTHRLTSDTTHDWENEVPELHWRTYVALGVFVVLQIAQVWLLGAPAFLAPFIVKDLGRPDLQNWIPVTSSLFQATFGPFVSFASDKFGGRRYWLGIPMIFGCIGAFVSATAKSVPVLLAGLCFNGISLASTPLAYAVPSEILPRRLRPVAQGAINFGAGMANWTTVLGAGGFLRINPSGGWRNSFYIGGALYAFIIVFFWIGYRPPHRPQPQRTFGQKLHEIDLVGNTFFLLGLVLLLVGISLGNNPFPWSNARPITLIVLGFVFLIVFGVWEWHRKDGILDAELFRERNFAITVFAVFVEGILLFGIQVFYPAETTAIWESDPFKTAARTIPFTLSTLIVIPPMTYYCSKYREMKYPLIIGYIFYTAGIIGFTASNENSSKAAIGFIVLAGMGFAPILTLLAAIAQLAAPSRLIGTATAILVSSRAVGASVGPTVLGAILTSKIPTNIPKYVVPAVLQAGLPPSSIPAFVGALAGNNPAAFASIPGVTPQVIGAGVQALRHALAVSFRFVWITLLPFGVLGIFSVVFIQRSKNMNFRIDAPVETDLQTHVKHSAA